MNHPDIAQQTKTNLEDNVLAKHMLDAGDNVLRLGFCKWHWTGRLEDWAERSELRDLLDFVVGMALGFLAADTGSFRSRSSSSRRLESDLSFSLQSSFRACKCRAGQEMVSGLQDGEQMPDAPKLTHAFRFFLRLRDDRDARNVKALVVRRFVLKVGGEVVLESRPCIGQV